MAGGRARAGGEIGMNGEHYAGGTFLPNTRLPKRGARARGARTNRVLVEPGVFATIIAENTGSLYQTLSALVCVENGVMRAAYADDHAAIAYYVGTNEVGLARFRANIAAYNQGERFTIIGE
jgi:hypothetical protein